MRQKPRSEADITREIAEIEVIINGLKNHEPFKMLVNKFERSVKFSDNTWHLIDVENKDKFYQLKYNKLSALGVIDAIPNLEQDLNMLQIELIELQNPDKIQSKSYDYEPDEPAKPSDDVIVEE